jgi:hypothetical protein
MIVALNELQASSSTNKYFTELDTFTSDPTSGDALNEWLSTPPLGMVAHPIAWWSRMGTGGHPLAPMALDFLSTPGMYIICCGMCGKYSLFSSHIHRCCRPFSDLSPLTTEDPRLTRSRCQWGQPAGRG